MRAQQLTGEFEDARRKCEKAKLQAAECWNQYYKSLADLKPAYPTLVDYQITKIDRAIKAP